MTFFQLEHGQALQKSKASEKAACMYNKYEVISAILGNLLSERELPSGLTVSEDVYNEMIVQGVGALPFPMLDWLSMDEELRGKWKVYCLQRTAKYLRVKTAQEKALRALEDAGIPVVVLKGTSAAQYYPYPELRASGDVDLLVKPEDLTRAMDVLAALSLPAKTPKLSDSHAAFRLENESFELHWKFAKTDNHGTDQILDGFLLAAIDRAENHCLPTLENGLVLLQHMNQHLMSGIGLRHFVDWMMFADKHLDESFLEAAEKVGLKKLAFSATQLCQQYLGLRQIVPDGDQSELWTYICEGGNFGKKYHNTGERQAEKLATQLAARNGAWLKRPYFYGLNQLHLTPKWYCAPLAWLCGVWHYSGLLLREVQSLNMLFKGKRRAEEKRRQMIQIGATRYTGWKEKK